MHAVSTTSVKIIDLAEFYAPGGGGVRTYVDQKLRVAAALGHELVVVAPGPENRVELRGAGKIVWLKSPYMPFDKRYHIFWDAAPVHAVLDAEAPDLIEASSPWRAGWIAARWPGHAKRVLFLHVEPVAAYPYRWFGRIAEPPTIDRMFEWFWSYLRRLQLHFDATVVGGTWMGERLAAHGLKPANVVPMGVETAVFSPDRRDASLRRDMLARCGVGEEALLLVGVGRHHPEKRWPMLIDAVERVNATSAREVGFVLAGDGVARAAVDRAVVGKARTRVLGQVADRVELATLMASADAMLHGSTSETFGMVVGEALSAGLPLIVPAFGGCTGLSAPAWAESYAPANAPAAAAAIVRLLARDLAPMRAAAAQAGATLVGPSEAHFSRLLALYGGIVGDAGVALSRAA